MVESLVVRTRHRKELEIGCVLHMGFKLYFLDSGVSIAYELYLKDVWNLYFLLEIIQTPLHSWLS